MKIFGLFPFRYILSAAIFLAGVFVTDINAQPGMPGAPSMVAPWENLIPIILGIAGYGLFKIRRNKKS